MLKATASKWFFWPLLVGLIIRLIISPITFHPDLLGHSFVAYFLAYEGVLNPYDHLLGLPANHPLVANFGVTDVFIYPPLTYFTLGIFRVLTMFVTDPGFVPFLWENLSSIFERKDLFSHLFWYKFPYFGFDIGIAFLLASLFNNEKQKKLAFTMWMFNPLTIYATFMMGQIDILPTFFVILSLYFAFGGKAIESMISLGIGGGYKMFPLLFLIPAACYFSEKFRERIKLLLIGLTPFVISIGPYIFSEAFRQMVLFSPKSQKMLFMIWKMTGAEGVYPFILLLFLIYLFVFYAKKFNLANSFSAILLITFSVTHYHPQWFLWITPLLILHAVQSNFKYTLLHIIFLVSWLLLTLFFESSLSVGLFSPLNPALAESSEVLGFLGQYTDIFMIKNLVRSIFASASLYYVYVLFSNTRENVQKSK